MLQVDIKLKESKRALTTRFKKEVIVKYLNRTFKKAAPGIEKQFKTLTEGAIRESPEYKSLLGGGSPSLKEHFGLADAEQRINAVIKEWSNNTFIKIEPFSILGNIVKGGLKLGIVREDLSEVLGLSASTLSIIIKTGEQRGQSFDIEWLKWLMSEGDKQIVTSHHISFASGRGRAGDFIMRQKGTWGVPPEFAGSKGNNFVTRSVSGLESKFAKIVKIELTK